MDKKIYGAHRDSDLRSIAEERVASQPGSTGSLLEEMNDKRLLHELQVNQVELEMLYNELLHIQADLLTEKSLKNDLVTWLAHTSSRESGEPFFNKLTRYLATCLDMDFVCIDYLEGDGLTAHTLAVWCDGHFEDNVTYALKDTPCGDVVGTHVCCFPAKVCQMFPHDQVLQELRAESYVGVTLWDHTGAPIGLIAVISRRSLVNRQQTETLMQLVAERAAAELERMISDEALREREVELEEAQLLAGTGSWTYDPVIRKAVWSKGMFHIWGLDPAHGLFPFEDHQKYIHPDDYPHFEAGLKDAVEHGTPYTMELRINRPDGSERTIITICEPRRDASGNVVKLRGTNQDITERKRVENALKKSEYFFKESQRSASIGSYQADFISGRWESSEVLDTIFGIDNEYDHSIQGWLDLVHPDDKEQMDRYLMEHVMSKRKPFSMEYRIIRNSDKETRWVNGLGLAEFDSAGNMLSLIGTIQDITARKNAEEALRESEERFRNLLQEVPSIAVQGYGPDGTAQYWNQASEKLYGYSAQEAIGRNLLDLIIPPEMRGDVEQAIRHMAETGQPIPASELSLMRKDGSQVPVFSSHTIVKVSGRVQELFCLDIDLSERKQAEQEKMELEQQLQHAQKLESLGVLAGGIAHDFNNILAIIVGHCSLAMVDPDRAENSIPVIEQAAQRAAGLCRQMLAYAGKSQFVQTRFDLGGLVDEMVQMLSSSLPQNAVIKLDSPAEMPFISGDASQIRQVVMNLIINASEAIGESHGEIRVSRAKTAIEAGQPVTDHLGKNIAPGWYVCLEVTDNGCGMDNETRQRLFEPFYTTKFTGRGLGMSAVLGIITSHGGALQLFSQPGQGTTFKVYLPVHISCDLVGDESFDQKPVEPWQGSGTILLVEDEESVMSVAQTMLEMLGFRVVGACNGKEALTLYQKNAIDISLVVTDVGMPVMDGYALFRELKALNPELPIIVSSGFGDTVVTSKISGGAAAGLISKPYSFDQLREVLKRVVEEK